MGQKSTKRGTCLDAVLAPSSVVGGLLLLDAGEEALLVRRDLGVLDVLLDVGDSDATDVVAWVLRVGVVDASAGSGVEGGGGAGAQVVLAGPRLPDGEFSPAIAYHHQVAFPLCGLELAVFLAYHRRLYLPR